jgi:hypothetical protein
MKIIFWLIFLSLSSCTLYLEENKISGEDNKVTEENSTKTDTSVKANAKIPIQRFIL